MTDDVTMQAAPEAAFSVDAEARTIRGLVVPYGHTARSGGQVWQFSRGTLQFSDVKRVKLFREHDAASAIGVAVELDDRTDGLYGTFRVAKGAKGDEALGLAAEGVLDGLSVGLGVGGKFARKDGVNVVQSAPVNEVSLVAVPAFSEARITSVRLSADGFTEAAPADHHRKETGMTEQVTTPEVAAETAPDFSALTDAIKEGFAAVVPQRQVIPAATPTAEVREELPYNFSGHKAAHSLLMDIADSKRGSGDAGERLAKFMTEDVAPAFANITTGNVSGLNPSVQRPELFVDALHYARPLWNMVTQGGLDSVTAQVLPKFGSSSGLVGDHTQGTEPTEGAYTATSQTVTPTALSGKAILNREVVDQGGSPLVDQLIWNEMTAGYFDNLEAAIAAALAAAASGEQNIGGGADDAAKVKLLKQYLSSLQFVKGGDRFAAFAADPTLYGLLTSATDSTGRPLLPILGPTNADGSLAPSMESVSVGGKRAVPAWALDKATANAELSYLFVPSSVYAWASAPARFDFSTKVSTVEIGIWGYKAAFVSRNSDVVAIDATTADA